MEDLKTDFENIPIEELILQRKVLYLRLTKQKHPIDKANIKEQLDRIDNRIMAKKGNGDYLYDEF